jgi:hypothetical protein
VPAARARPIRQIDRQVDVAAVWKLQIAQMDTKAAFAPAAALEDIARADRESVGKTVYSRTHDKPPGELARPDD